MDEFAERRVDDEIALGVEAQAVVDVIEARRQGLVEAPEGLEQLPRASSCTPP